MRINPLHIVETDAHPAASPAVVNVICNTMVLRTYHSQAAPERIFQALRGCAERLPAIHRLAKSRKSAIFHCSEVYIGNIVKIHYLVE